MEDFSIFKAKGLVTAPEILLPKIQRKVFVRRVRRISLRVFILLAVCSAFFIFQRPQRQLQVMQPEDLVDINSPILQIGVEDSSDTNGIEVADAEPILEI